MQKHLLFLVFCFLTATTINAQYSLTVADPNSFSTARTQGIITSPEITVTPNGAYAKIEMTFTFNAQSTYKASDNLEAVLLFDLPQGSFIHDSWLWLNEQVIIQADVVEKNRAISIYRGIVIKKRDPSLLIKTGPNSYKLNVYPMTINYPRKVKLTYSVPFKWQYDKASVELPVNLFATSQYPPDILVKVKHDFEYATPAFTDQDYSKYFMGNTNGEDAVLIRGNNYANTSFNLSYTINNPKIQLYTYPVNANEGVYQLIVPPASFGVNKTLNTVFVIDHPNTNNTIYTLAQIKQNLRAALLSNYSSRDSFNIFYESGGNIVKAFSTWQHVNLTSVDNAINNIPLSISTSSNKYEDLMKAALSFCGTKAGTDGQVVVLSNNSNYTNNQSTVDAMFNSLKTHIGGTFSNKVHVVNYSTTKTTISGVQHNANDIWYSKLTLASGGSLYKYSKYTSEYINGKYTSVYDLNASVVLNAIADNSGIATSSYNVNIGISNGFTYSAYNLHPVNRMNMSKHFVQTGRYKGSAGLGTTVDIQALSGSTVVNITDTINSISNGNATMVKEWTYHFLADLIGKNTSAYAQEIIDSSIRNRVLCEYTAFLALETGDTMSTNTNDNPNLSILNEPDAKNSGVKCYPNPFADKLVIELAAGTELLEVFDLMGRKVFSFKVTDGKLSYTWNGRDNAGNDLPSGMYMVIASTATERFTTKVMKQ